MAAAISPAHRRFSTLSTLSMLLVPVVAASLASVSCANEKADIAIDKADAAPEGPAGGPGADAASADAGVPWSVQTLSERTIVASQRSQRVELVRATRPDGRHSYLLYTHASNPKAPLVVMNEPYVGIDWTGDPLDARWAALGKGAHPDVDGPAYAGKDQFSYDPQSIQAAVDSQGFMLLNGFATLRAYGRYYAGGTIADDALDAAAPYYFARTRGSEIDLAHIASFGGSWGGMMALFGARQAPPDASPVAVVALSPVSDFLDLWKWATVDLPAVYPQPSEAAQFYSPYWRRATPVLGQPPAPSDASRPFTHAGLCPGLPGRVVVPHDDWDSIIPVRETEQLAAACPNVEPLYWRRKTPTDYAVLKMDHGAFGHEPLISSAFTFSFSFIALALAPPTAQQVVSVAHEPALEAFLQTLLDEQKAGRNVDFALPRLREIADPRLLLLDAAANVPVAGADMLSKAVNAVWNTHYDAAGLRTQLVTGLPAPP